MSDSLQVIQAKLPLDETYCLWRQDLPKQGRNQTLALLLFWLRHEKDMHKIAFIFSNKNWKSNAKAASPVPYYRRVTGTDSHLWTSHMMPLQLKTEAISDHLHMLLWAWDSKHDASWSAKLTKARFQWFCVFCSRNECRNLPVPWFLPFKIGQSRHEGLNWISSISLGKEGHGENWGPSAFAEHIYTLYTASVKPTRTPIIWEAGKPMSKTCLSLVPTAPARDTWD